MKKSLLLMFVFSTSLSFSQEDKFSFSTETGFTDYVVVPFEDKSKEDLYKKAVNWIEYTYKNPKEVLKGNIENEYIRFTGAVSGLVCINALGKNCYETRYTIEISFKDNKCKFDIIDIEYYVPSSKYMSGGWNNLVLNEGKVYTNKKGELRGIYKYIPEIPNYFNNLIDVYSSFILNTNSTTANSNDW